MRTLVGCLIEFHAGDWHQSCLNGVFPFRHLDAPARISRAILFIFLPACCLSIVRQQLVHTASKMVPHDTGCKRKIINANRIPPALHVIPAAHRRHQIQNDKNGYLGSCQEYSHLTRLDTHKKNKNRTYTRSKEASTSERSATEELQKQLQYSITTTQSRPPF